MIHVKLYDEGCFYNVMVTGHADGRPEVCAAMSALLQTVYTWLQRTNSAHVFEDTMESGSCCLQFGGNECGTVFSLLQLGVARLRAAAPDSVVLEEFSFVEPKKLDLEMFGKAAGEEGRSGTPAPAGGFANAASAPAGRDDPARRPSDHVSGNGGAGGTSPVGNAVLSVPHVGNAPGERNAGEWRAAAASGRGRRPGISAAAPLAGRKQSRPGNGKCGKADGVPYLDRHATAYPVGRGLAPGSFLSPFAFAFFPRV